MDQFLGVFSSLGVDITVFYQFAIFMVLFIILKFLFFNKLQFVIELREEKTEKLIKHASDKFNEAEVMASNYNLKIEKAHSKAHEILSSKKRQILDGEREAFKEVEKKALENMEETRLRFAKDLEKRKSEILKSADELANNLVNKFT